MEEFTMNKRVSDEFMSDLLALALVCAETDATEVDFDIKQLHVHIEFSMNEEEE